MENLRKIALIVAAGSSSRMGMAVPKQFHPLGGIPLAIHPAMAFREAFPDIELVYVIASGTAQIWETLLIKHLPAGNWRLCMGGKSRYESVRNGLRSIRDENSMVAVHDGARPFIKSEEIQMAFQYASENGNAVFAVPVKDSLRQVNADGSSHFLDRNLIYAVQTPQIFYCKDMLGAYAQEDDARFTDDATVMEIAGFKIFLCKGDYNNLKITTPEDWILAEKILEERRQGNQDSLTR